MYVCTELEANMICDRRSVHVSLLSRTTSLTKAQRAVLMGHLDLDCIEDGQITPDTTGTCL